MTHFKRTSLMNVTPFEPRRGECDGQYPGNGSRMYIINIGSFFIVVCDKFYDLAFFYLGNRSFVERVHRSIKMMLYRICFSYY